MKEAVTSRCSPGPGPTTPPTRSSSPEAATECRRRRRARGHPVLQPPLPGRASSGHMAAVASRRPTLPVMVYDIPVRTGRRIALDTMVRARPRGAQHRGGEGLDRAMWPRRPGCSRAPRPPSRSTAVTTTSPWPWPRSARSALVSVASHWAGREMAGDAGRLREGRRRRRPRRQRPPARLLRLRDRARPFPTRCRPRRPAGPSGWPSASAGTRSGPAPDELDQPARRVLEGLGTSVA